MPGSNELLEPVLARTSNLASETISKLCQELAANKNSTKGRDYDNGGRDKLEVGLPELEVFSSSVTLEEAPLGVRTKLHARPGQIICLYPGRIFEADEQNLPKSDMLYSNEYEGVYIDGKGWFPVHWRENALLATHSASRGTLWHGNRLAVGNLLNHPPKGTLPNCVPMAFRWPAWQEIGEASPAYWARLVPHVVLKCGRVMRTASGESPTGAGDQVAKDRVWFPPWPHMGVALVAVRSLQPGDELFWNYRLHPRADAAKTARYPDWYAPVDDAEFEDAVARDSDMIVRL